MNSRTVGNRLLFLCVLMSLAYLPGLANASQPHTMAELQVGDPVPEFEMKGSDGNVYKAENFVGKKAVIIAWFPRAFTGGCTKECKSMKEHGALLKKFDVAYFTASTDSVERNAEFAKSLSLDYPILCDPQGVNAALFGVLRNGRNAAARVTFVIGKDGKIASIQKKVNTADHGKDLAELLEKLGVESSD